MTEEGGVTRENATVTCVTKRIYDGGRVWKTLVPFRRTQKEMEQYVTWNISTLTIASSASIALKLSSLKTPACNQCDLHTDPCDIHILMCVRARICVRACMHMCEG